MTGPRAVSRRIPSQERSKRRVEAILDAAARAFAEVGFEVTTMERIAEESGSSIGSVYQFFANKQAVFAALAERCLERSRASFDRVFSEGALGRPWHELLELAIDTLWSLRESDPGFRALVANFQLYDAYEEADAALQKELVERVTWLVTAAAPTIPPARRAAVAITVVNTVIGTMFLAQREKPALARQLVEETKLLLRRYLEAFVEA